MEAGRSGGGWLLVPVHMLVWAADCGTRSHIMQRSCSHSALYTAQALIRVLTQLPDAATAAASETIVAEDDMLGLGHEPALPSAQLVKPSTPPDVDAAVNRLADLLSRLHESLRPLLQSEHIEVLERARSFHRLLASLLEAHQQGRLTKPLAALRAALPGLKAVAPKAQRRVKLPEGLDLHTPIYEPEPDAISDDGIHSGAEPPLFTTCAADEGATTAPKPSVASPPQGIYYLPTDPAPAPAPTEEQSPAAADRRSTAPPASAGRGVREGSFVEEWEEEPPAVVLNMEGEELPSPHEDDEKPIKPKHKHRHHHRTERQHSGQGPDLMDMESSPAAEGESSGRQKHRRRKHRSDGSHAASNDLVNLDSGPTQ